MIFFMQYNPYIMKLNLSNLILFLTIVFSSYNAIANSDIKYNKVFIKAHAVSEAESDIMLINMYASI